MSSINQVSLIGRLTRDAELKYTNSGSPVSSMAIAVNRSEKKGDEWVDEVSFFDLVMWGKRGESLQQYLTRGTQIAVSGELEQQRWEKDGQQNSRVVVKVSNIQLLGGNQPQSQQQQNNQDFNNQQQGNSNQGGNFEDDIPF